MGIFLSVDERVERAKDSIEDRILDLDVDIKQREFEIARCVAEYKSKALEGNFSPEERVQRGRQIQSLKHIRNHLISTKTLLLDQRNKLDEIRNHKNFADNTVETQKVLKKVNSIISPAYAEKIARNYEQHTMQMEVSQDFLRDTINDAVDDEAVDTEIDKLESEILQDYLPEAERGKIKMGKSPRINKLDPQIR